MFMRKYKLEDKFPRDKHGNFMDQAGNPITGERIERYANLAKMVILRTHERGESFYGPGYFDDLFQEVRYEGVVYCLINFDPDKALNMATAAEGRRRSGKSNAEWLQWKRDNPTEALKILEYDWVSNGLTNACRRLAWDYGEATAKKHGRQLFLTDYEKIEHMICRAEDESSFGDFEDKPAQVSVPDLSVGDSGISNISQASSDYETILSLATDGKAAEAKSFLDGLSATRKDDVKAYKATLDNAGDRSQFLAQIAETVRKTDAEKPRRGSEE